MQPPGPAPFMCARPTPLLVVLQLGPAAPGDAPRRQVMPDFCGPCGNPVDGALPPGAAVAGSLPQTVGEHHACTREMAIRRHRELVGLARPPRPCPGPQHRDIEARGRLRDRADPALLRVEVGAEAARAAGAGAGRSGAGLSLKACSDVDMEAIEAAADERRAGTA